MSCIAQSKDWIDYLVSITPICIALFAAYIAGGQLRTNREKLRLDLYNKRFEVYENTLVFYQALISFDAANANGEFETQHKAFIKSMKESQFLFDSTSGIYQVLMEFHKNAFKVIGAKRHGKEIFDSGSHDEASKMYNDMHTVLTGFPFEIDKIEKAIAPYLNFHKIVA